MSEVRLDDTAQALAAIGARADPLTKAMLYVSTEDGNWTQVGVGEVVVTHTPDAPVEIVVRSLPPDESDCLLRTPIRQACVFTIHEETTLLWQDREIGRDVALCFVVADGCSNVMEEIRNFQQSGNSGPHSTAEDLWGVSPDNLSRVLDAARMDTLNFSEFFRSQKQYWHQLAALFHQSCAEHQDNRAAQIAEIALSLLRPPYTSEPDILAQIVECINDSIDMVQYGLGKRDTASGYVSAPERRSAFRNPCELDETVLEHIHLLYSCNYLRDLLPLSLDDSDQMSPSPLIDYVEAFQNQLIEKICCSQMALPRALQKRSMSIQEDASIPFDLVNFVLELSKAIKGSRIDLDAKAARYFQLFEAGLLPFFTSVLMKCLTAFQGEDIVCTPSLGWELGRAIQSVGETLAHAVAFFPPVLNYLFLEASNTPERSTLYFIMSGVLSVRQVAVQHSLYDFVSSVFVQGMADPLRKNIILFWVNASCGPPVRSLLVRAAALFSSIMEASSGLAQYAEQELLALYSLKITKLFIEVGDKSIFVQVWQHFHDSELLAAFASFISLETHRYANLQSSAVSWLAGLVRCGLPHLVVKLCMETKVLDAAVETYLRRCRRNTILTSALANLLKEISKAAEECAATDVYPPFFSHLQSGDTDLPSYWLMNRAESRTEHLPADGSIPHPFKPLIESLLQKYGEPLRMTSRPLYDLLLHGLQEADRSVDQSVSCTATVDPVSSSPDVSPVKTEAGGSEAARNPGRKSASTSVRLDLEEEAVEPSRKQPKLEGDQS